MLTKQPHNHVAKLEPFPLIDVTGRAEVPLHLPQVILVARSENQTLQCHARARP